MTKEDKLAEIEAALTAARVLQILHIGPVAPQTHPEEVCIGIVSVTSNEG